MDNYYAVTKFLVEAPGSDILVIGKPGVWSWNQLNPGSSALLEVIEVETNDAILDLGCGTGVIGSVAARLCPEACITLIDCSLPAVSCAERTVAANGFSHAEIQLADGVQRLRPSTFDVVLSHLPRGRAVQEELIEGAARVLRPGGRFYFVASTRSGVKGAIKYTRELLGRCGVIRQKKGYHVAMAVRPAGLSIKPSPPSYASRTVICDGIETRLVSKPGVFAWDRLDDGTAALVQAMRIDPGDHVLDLGCGTGLAGLAAARRAPLGHVALVDADARAAESARLTLAANGVENSEVISSDCASAVYDREFDVVVTNPPFHRGLGVEFDVAHQFVRDAARVLGPGGHLFLVANRHLSYATLVRDVFGNVAQVAADARYQVLTAEKRPAHLRPSD